MVDRPIRPLWPKGYKNEVQVIITTLSADQVHGHDILGMNGASAALMLSPLPFMGPVGAVRVGRIDGQLLLNPTLVELQDSTLDLIVCGTPEAITMVEAGAEEIDEDTLVEALELAHGADQADLPAADRAGQPRPACPSGRTVPSPSSCAPAAPATWRPPSRPVAWRRCSPRPTRSSASEAPEISGSSSEADMLQRVRTQFAIEQLVGEARDAAVYPKVKQQFADAGAGAVRRRAGLQGAQVGQAGRAAGADRGRDRPRLPQPRRG